MKKESSPNTRMFKASRPPRSRSSSEMARSTWTWKWSKRNTWKRSMIANLPNREQENQKEETRNQKRKTDRQTGDPLCRCPSRGSGEAGRADHDASSRRGRRIRPPRPTFLANHAGRFLTQSVGDEGAKQKAEEAR